MTSSGGSLETSADSFPNISFTTTQFMNSSFSDLLASNDYEDTTYNQNKDRISLSSSRGFSDRIGSNNNISGGVPKFKSIQPPSLPISPPSAVSPSSYFSIPPGLSPAELLDSPVLLSSNIMPSPTTGTFPGDSFNWRGNYGNFQQNIKQETARNYSTSSASADFSFQPQPWNNNNSQEPNSTKQLITDFSSYDDHQQRSIVKSEFPPAAAPAPLLQSFSPEISTILQTNNNINGGKQGSSDYNNNPYSSQPSHQTLREKRRSEDGYNWRKYGQKQVKGSENPRSYYKCTYPNCPTKKKVERSLEGQITEIVYKGSHNHPMPTSSRRSSSSSSTTNTTSHHHQIHQASSSSSSVIVPTSSSDHFINQVGSTTQIELVTTPENSSISIGDDQDDQNSQKSKSGGDEFDEEEPQPKRWKKENENEADLGEGGEGILTGGAGSRTVREPRVVVQTTSDIDILDDGYRWRKYGQKVVKGNPNPRSYYKCTSNGCAVRKHVERASHDLRAVITTYEGKHNHDVPAARGSGSNIINRQLPPAAAAAATNGHDNINATSHQSNNNHQQENKTPFTLEMLRNPTRSFGFSGYNNNNNNSMASSDSFLNKQQQQQDVFSKSSGNYMKEEPQREDMFLESLLY